MLVDLDLAFACFIQPLRIQNPWARDLLMLFVWASTSRVVGVVDHGPLVRIHLGCLLKFSVSEFVQHVDHFVSCYAFAFYHLELSDVRRMVVISFRQEEAFSMLEDLR